MIIRNAVDSDIDALVSLLRDLFSIEADFTFDADKHRRGLKLLLDGCRKHKCVKVAEVNTDDGTEVVGMCTAQTLISTAEGGIVAMVEDLVVDSRFRGQGVGRMLMENIEVWSRMSELKRLQLLADTENKPALAFYKKNNWDPTQLICIRKKFR